MKKIILILLVLALAVPSAVLAATEFSLGGFIKLDTFWDSTQQGKNMNTAIARNNDPNFQHGRYKATAQGSRFSFTIKGPKLWGAQTTGFMEFDMDSQEEGATTSYAAVAAGAATATQRGSGVTASNSYVPRMRHAMFRLNWPETELLMGQYWSMFCEWWPEVAQDGPFQGTGIPTARLPQIRVTQKFLGAWTASALIGEPNAALGNRTFSLVDRNGAESSEMPQIQGKIQFQQDLWGKAAYTGVPTPFTAQIVGGVQRNDFGAINASGLRTFSDFGYSAALGAGNVTNHQILYPWMVMGTLFVPVIPTTSANLAGTASLMTQWWVGQGAEAFGFAGIGSQIYKFTNNIDANGNSIWDVQLQQRFGGYVQGQYYFTNQWFMTAAWAMSKAFNVGHDTNINAVTGNNPNGYTNALAADQQKLWQEFDLCLWYRPIQALKFGLQYSYGQTNWFQNTGISTAGAAVGFGTGDITNQNFKDEGNAHRVEFVGFFFF
jgi:hypothetical protein